MENNLRFREDLKILLLDVETLNLALTFHFNRPWQIAYLYLNGSEIVEERDYKVKWDTDLTISKGAAYITKYNHEEVQRLARDEKEVFDLIYPRIEEADYIMGHNILGFDVPLLKDWYRKHDKDWSKIPDKIIDTNCVARGFFYEMKFDPENETFLEYQYKIMNTRIRGVKSSLSYLAKYFDLDFEEEKLHDALDDIHLNLKVWEKLKHLAKV